jgi:hypothetical protein
MGNANRPLLCLFGEVFLIVVDERRGVKAIRRTSPRESHCVRSAHLRPDESLCTRIRWSIVDEEAFAPDAFAPGSLKSERAVR